MTYVSLFSNYYLLFDGRSTSLAFNSKYECIFFLCEAIEVLLDL